MTKERKESITVWSAIAMLFFGCSLTLAGFIISPVGEVHDSVLWVLGQALLYSGGALGIANYARTSAKEAVQEYEEERRRLRELNEDKEYKLKKDESTSEEDVQ